MRKKIIILDGIPLNEKIKNNLGGGSKKHIIGFERKDKFTLNSFNLSELI